MRFGGSALVIAAVPHDRRMMASTFMAMRFSCLCMMAFGPELGHDQLAWRREIRCANCFGLMCRLLDGIICTFQPRTYFALRNPVEQGTAAKTN